LSGPRRELELDLEREVGRDALALPQAGVLLDDALHALDVLQIGRLEDVIDAERLRDAHLLADVCAATAFSASTTSEDTSMVSAT
jgi:hypothetical protein